MADHFTRIRAARTALGVSQRKLADEAGVHRNSVLSLDHGLVVSLEIVMACQRALERRGVEFLEIGGRLGLILPAAQSYVAQFVAARVGLGLVQKDFAKCAGLDLDVVLSLERGENTATEEDLNKCIRVFGDMDAVLFDIDDRRAILFAQTSIAAEPTTGSGSSEE